MSDKSWPYPGLPPSVIPIERLLPLWGVEVDGEIVHQSVTSDRLLAEAHAAARTNGRGRVVEVAPVRVAEFLRLREVEELARKLWEQRYHTGSAKERSENWRALHAALERKT